MIKALVFLFVTPFLVVGINVPRSHSLVKRNARITVPRTLQEGGLDLVVRQGTCSIGEVACTNGGCCDGSCCGDGCCPLSYFCDTVSGVTACCQVGEVCNSQISGCTDNTLAPCKGYDFCCPLGNDCSLDGNGNAQCNGITIGNGNEETTISPITTPSIASTTSYFNNNPIPMAGAARLVVDNTVVLVASLVGLTLL